jgi:hypothetical protein
MKKALFVAACTAAAVVIGIAGYFVFLSGNPKDTTPVTFNGPWQAKFNEATLNAVISGDGIEIHWVTSQTDAVYWKGTFPVPQNVTYASVFTIVSVGDTAAMEESLLASQDESKAFTFDNGKLQFKMTVMGVTQTVALEQIDPGV